MGQSVHVISVVTLSAIFSLMRGPEISSTASNRKDQVGGNPLSLYRPLCHSWRALRQPMGFCWRASTVLMGTPSLTASLPQTGIASQTPSSPASDGVRSVHGCMERTHSLLYNMYGDSYGTWVARIHSVGRAEIGIYSHHNLSQQSKLHALPTLLYPQSTC